MRLHLFTKNFSHHSAHSGYDRLLDFVTASSARLPKASAFLPNKYKTTLVEACQAKWDHYGAAELNREIDLISYTPFRKHLFHFLYGENTFCYSARLNRHNKVLVATYHQPESWFNTTGHERRKYFVSRIKELDAVIAVSNDQADFFRQFNSNVYCVHHGIDTDFFSPPSIIETGTRHICQFVGNWLRDFDTLINVINLLKLLAPNITVRVVTPEKNRPLFSGVEAEILSGISDQELRETYKSASVVLLPLKDCTANNSALEAMACGLPIVVTDIGGIRDYLTEECAVFCKPNDAEHMAAAVIDLCKNSDKRTGMGRVAREIAVSKFAWPIIGRKMLDVYKGLS